MPYLLGKTLCMHMNDYRTLAKGVFVEECEEVREAQLEWLNPMSGRRHLWRISGMCVYITASIVAEFPSHSHQF
jgi:hypothetical protein